MAVLSEKVRGILLQRKEALKRGAASFSAKPKVFDDNHVFKMSPSQKKAADFIVENDGFHLLTGEAGSGKSYVIHYLNSIFKSGAVNTATTGIAAQLIGGRTTFSYASIHPRLGAVKSYNADKRVRGTKILFIDEISMGNDWFLTQLISRFEQCDFQPDKIVFVGDFFQLPPVEGEMVFKSDLWPMLNVNILKLKEQHRQSDDGFITALNELRVGRVTKNVLNVFKGCKCAALPEDCVQLYSLRAKVDAINQRRLDELPGEGLTFEWHTWQTNKPDAKVDFEQFRFPSKLSVKDGARIVMLNNDQAQRWVNGSTGTILSLPSEDDKESDGFITVQLDKDERVVKVAPATEELYGGDGDVIATVRQYPLMLAWALTVHKAQGMSMDRVGVDLTRHFASGMTYVAMSRARSKEGLFLIGNFNRVPVCEDAFQFE